MAKKPDEEHEDWPVGEWPPDLEGDFRPVTEVKDGAGAQ